MRSGNVSYPLCSASRITAMGCAFHGIGYEIGANLTREWSPQNSLDDLRHFDSGTLSRLIGFQSTTLAPPDDLIYNPEH